MLIDNMIIVCTILYAGCGVRIPYGSIYLNSGSEDNIMAWLFDIRNNYHISTILKVMEVSMDERISHLIKRVSVYAFWIILRVFTLIIL